MNIIEGDLFALVKENDGGNVIIHGCNCMGAFAAGVAGLVRNNYPRAYEDYAHAHKEGTLIPGSVHYSFIDEDIIINAMTQYYPGAHAKLEHIEACFNKIIVCLKLIAERGLIKYDNIWLPAIGCGIGGLVFDQVYPLFEKLNVLEEYGYTVNLVLYK